MSDDETQTVEGVVTDLYRSSSENKPHGVHIDGNRYTTFNDKDVEGIEEGTKIRFQYEQNGEHRNIVNGSVEIIEQDEESEVYGSTDGVELFGPTDARIGAQSAIRSSVMHHQHREGSTDEDVVDTAETFVEAQIDLYRKLRNAGKEGE